MSAWLELRGLKKAFSRATALNHLDLNAAKGEFIVVVGPSGCGKSTLLRLLAGLERPDAGGIFLDGLEVTNLPAQKRDVAMVFQDYALYPHLTVAGNLAFPLVARKLPKPQREAKVAEVAARLDLTKLLDAYPKTLSGGQRQRVAVGRAWVRDPKLFLYDEPLSNLDAALRGDLRRELMALKETLGITSLYVTHDQVEALTLADRVIVLKDGDALQTGTPREIYDTPAHAFVASFIGQPPMKLLRVRRAPDGWVSARDASGPDAALAGARPEDWLPGEGPGLQIQAAVTAREFTGATLVLTLETDTGETFYVTRPEAAPLPAGFSSWHCPLSKLHLFDPASQCRLTVP